MVNSGVFSISHLSTSTIRGSGTGKPISAGEPRRQVLVRQHPWMLRIVLKFNDVIVFIRAPHQVGLSAAPHTTNLLGGLDNAVPG